MGHRLTVLFIAMMTSIQFMTFHQRLPKFQSNATSWGYDIVWNETRHIPRDEEKMESLYDLDYGLSIVITSNLIPMHPNTSFVKKTIASLLCLEELPKDTPIFITVDGLRPNNRDPNKTAVDHERRSRYISRLESISFHPFTNIQVLAMDKHRHISGSVNEALKHISNYAEKHHQQHAPSNHFVYLLQHDLYFRHPIPHTKLIKAMKENPEDLKNIRFRFNPGLRNQSDEEDQNRFPPCHDLENGTVFERSGLPFFATARWSDHNQLSTLQYYDNMIAHIQNTTANGRLNLPMEWVLMTTAKKRCREWGQVVLGNRVKRLSYLGHLDGRHTEDVQGK